jgi:hypothetical protein
MRRWMVLALVLSLHSASRGAQLVSDEDFFTMRRRLDRERYETERAALLTWKAQLIKVESDEACRYLHDLTRRYRREAQLLEDKRQLRRAREQEDADQRALERGKPRKRY